MNTINSTALLQTDRLPSMGTRLRSALSQWLRRIASVVAAALILAGTSAQGQTNVYSFNIVGYVNVTLTNGYNFIGNPLNNSSNTLSVLIPSAPDGTAVYVWDVASQSFSPPSVYSGGWDSNRDYVIPVGKGFAVYAPTGWTATFVGEVLQGNLTNFIAGSNKFSLLASMVPQALPLSGTPPWSLEFPGTGGDNVFFFQNASLRYTDACTYFGGLGWFDPNGVCTTNGPVPNVGDCFFVQHPGPDINWVRYFTVQRPASVPALPQKGLFAANEPSAAAIRSLTIRSGEVTLNISNSIGGRYNVQFSTDRHTWKTVAPDQTGTVWRGPCPDGGQGYYQLVKL